MQCKQMRREAWKSQDFNGFWTRDVAIPVGRSNQLSYEATDVGSWYRIARSRVQTSLKSWLFQASLRNCLNCVHNCDDHSLLDFKSAVQYMKHFIYHFTSIHHGLIRTHKWPAPNVSGLIAQLLRASHRYREGTGSNHVEAAWLFQASIRSCLNCVHNCDDHSLLDNFHLAETQILATFLSFEFSYNAIQRPRLVSKQ